jgi:SNF2 family DNA or RNA helicase
VRVLTKPPAILLTLKEPDKLLSVLPTAKAIEHQGQTLVAVPHRPDETKFLRNLGLKVPSPILTQYQWSGRQSPFHAQRETAAMLAVEPRAFVLNSLGTGKTLSALWSFDYLRKRRIVKKALVVAPLSTLERAWGDEIFTHFPHLNFKVIHGSRQRRLDLLDEEADIYIINFDGLKIIQDALADRADIDLLIIDELATLRGSKTDRWKAANIICNKQFPNRRVWGLTGTPIPNAPTDAYGQLKLMQVPGIPRSFTAFREATMRQITQFKWIAKDDALDTVARFMQPSVRFTMDDCLDLPEQVHIARDAPLTPAQKKAYKDMLEKLRVELESGEITAVNEAAKANKIMQICCGSSYGAEGEVHTIGAEPRLAVVEELVEESEAKVLVFVPFRSAVTYVTAHLEKAGYNCAHITGETKKSERDDIFQRFQSGSELRVIVAIPSCMSHGLTLTAASTIIWYGPITSNEIFEQANGRVRRPSQTKRTVIAEISGSTIEARYYTRLRDKQDTQGTLLDIIKQGGI